MLNKLDNWWWKVLNKKPPTPRGAYFQVVLPWCGIGMLSALLLLLVFTLLASDTDSVSLKTWIVIGVGAAFILGYGIFWAVSNIREDKSVGYFDAIAKVGQNHWEAEATRLGMIKEGEGKTEQNNHR